jgi:hypothetical protein
MVREIFNPMVREMRYYDPAVGYGSFETPLRHQDAGAILRGCSFMSAMSSSSGRPEARSDSRIDNDTDWLAGNATVTPTPADIQQWDTCCQLAYNIGIVDERLRRVRADCS